VQKLDDPDVPAKFVFMVARRTHMAAFCLERRSIDDLEDLAGAPLLGAADSAFVLEYRALLGRLGVAPGPLIELPYERVMDALAEGEGDVAADYLDLLPAFEAAARRRGERIRVLPFGPAVRVYGSGLVAGTRVIEQRPGAVRGAVASLREALLSTRRDPRAGLDALLARFPGADPERALAGWRAGEQLIFDDGADMLGRMDEETWQRTIDFHADAHGTPRIAAPSVFDPSFVSYFPRINGGGGPDRVGGGK
jgi:ABC-type nitrate/sulfonate/bicarbonate transport system substrate-binding protein